jgi:hypothetical protein
VRRGSCSSTAPPSTAFDPPEPLRWPSAIDCRRSRRTRSSPRPAA